MKDTLTFFTCILICGMTFFEHDIIQNIDFQNITEKLVWAGIICAKLWKHEISPPPNHYTLAFCCVFVLIIDISLLSNIAK
jgi:hypothetical protein